MVANTDNTKEWGTFERIIVQYWSGLDGLGDFRPLQPAYIPTGLRLEQLGFHYLPIPTGIKPPTKRNGVVIAVYLSDDGFVIFRHGWGMGPPASIADTVPHGVSAIGPLVATWIRGREPGGVGPPKSTKPDEVYLRLGWRPEPRGSAGPGWLLTTDCLPLEELERMAVSLN